MEMLTRGILLALWLVLSVVAQAHTQIPSASTDGYAWLSAQQVPSGAIQAPADLAGPLQTTYEATLAFANSDLLGQLDLASLSAYLDQQQTVGETEHVAKLLTLRLKLGQGIEDLETRLLTAQNYDGGFGDNPGYDSTVYDTVFALQALAQTRYKNSPAAGKAITYLLQQQNADGGFGLDSEAPSSPYFTALMLRSLQPYLYTFNVGQALTEARDYLFAHVETGSDWPSDWEAAQFLLAVVPMTTDVELYKGSLEWLRMQQGANGSWQNDAFSTALALQALYLSENISFPTAPDTATLKGRVVDASTGQALIGVNIALSPAVGDAMVTDAAGAFVIPGLKPNTYSLTYTAAGYLPASLQLETKVGQLLDLGAVSLQVAPTTALVTGTISDANTGTALVNAVVEVVVGQDRLQAMTGLDGSYAIAAPAGSITLSAMAEGYRPATAAAAVAAGSSVRFSPGLYKVSEEPAPLELAGRVVDADSQAPLAGVNVTHVASGDSVLTGAQGTFLLSGIVSGEQRFELALPGYQGVVLSAVLPANGRVDAGVIQLSRQEQSDTTTVSGRVLDGDTGLGVAGAMVAVDGLATATDSAGRYSIAGISSLDFIVGANASGYSYGSQPVSLAQHRALELDVTLMRADIAGIAVDAVATGKSEYAAYERVNLQATLTNKTVRERRIRLYVLVTDLQGVVIDRFPAVDVPLPTDTSEPEALAHYEQHLEDALEVLAPNETRVVALETGWNTGRQLPGRYRVTVQALEGSSSQLVAERATLFDILPTQRLASATLEASPSYALMNSSPEVTFKLSLRNSSNEATQSSLHYVLRTPTGELLKQGQTVVDLLPEETTKEVLLDTLQHSFVESGHYPLELTVTDGTVPEAVTAGALFVPPTVRLTVEQDLTPEQVLPGEARKVQIQIQVKGVDGE